MLHFLVKPLLCIQFHPPMAERSKLWMIVYTKPRHEKKVADLLTKKSINNYCPTRRVLRQWSDRKKYVDEVLIRSYVFVKVEESERIHVLQTPGVLNFVYWLRKPAIVREVEMKALMDFLSSAHVSEINVRQLEVGAKVRVLSGPLIAQEGEILKIDKNVISIRLYSAGLEFTAILDKDVLEVIEAPSKKQKENKLINRIQ